MSEDIQTGSEAATGDAGLRRGVMGGGELAAQAIANIAPSAVIAFTAAAIYNTATNGTWVSFALATVVILSVGYCISQFAKRRSSAGSLYSYAATALGPFGAYLTGVSLLIGCFGIAAGSLSGSVAYTATLLNQLGIPIHGTAAQIVLAVILGALATLFTIRGIRLSARVSLVLELISVSIITLLLVVTLIHLGAGAFDAEQFELTDVKPSGIAVGMVLAILGFVGFSSSDALAREAKDPYRAVPRAIMWSAAGVGVLYIFAAYTQVAALGPALANRRNRSTTSRRWSACDVVQPDPQPRHRRVVLRRRRRAAQRGRPHPLRDGQGGRRPGSHRPHARNAPHAAPRADLGGPARDRRPRGDVPVRRGPDERRHLGRHLRHVRLHGGLRRRGPGRRDVPPQHRRARAAGVARSRGGDRVDGLCVLRQRVPGPGVPAQRHPVAVRGDSGRGAGLVLGAGSPVTGSDREHRHQ
ncbi:APC family permease [Mycolicibacterium mageritense]|uniref:APC family permease n=1 Tax=Mycolicibacterium mageritense TaxID=53462 RepID=UPI001E30D20E|nr:APC family permease [Mycolicibacterium mageritense]MCC9183804.1 APC family permease [Mycolicibacterium mageritense]